MRWLKYNFIGLRGVFFGFFFCHDVFPPCETRPNPFAQTRNAASKVFCLQNIYIDIKYSCKSEVVLLSPASASYSTIIQQIV